MTDTNALIEPLIEERIEIAAPPEQVWALVSDPARMAQFSPQVLKTVVRGGEVGLGTRTVNINRDGLKVWPTRSKVVRFEPAKEFAFRIKDNRTIWSFTLEPTATGTTLVHRRETPDGVSPISQTLVHRFMGGIPQFQVKLREGMQQTLAKIKAEAEKA